MSPPIAIALTFLAVWQFLEMVVLGRSLSSDEATAIVFIGAAVRPVFEKLHGPRVGAEVKGEE